ncbi:hypothetical protein, partial [Granulicella sp. dw_53]|uniref:hypothetical protein n=1 Tax=Granulicella sp. dw_53 TaxID=2719792 RepID=UPI001BD5F507
MTILLLGRERTSNGNNNGKDKNNSNRRSFDYGTHDETVSPFAQRLSVFVKRLVEKTAMGLPRKTLCVSRFPTIPAADLYGRARGWLSCCGLGV